MSLSFRCLFLWSCLTIGKIYGIEMISHKPVLVVPFLSWFKNPQRFHSFITSAIFFINPNCTHIYWIKTGSCGGWKNLGTLQYQIRTSYLSFYLRGRWAYFYSMKRLSWTQSNYSIIRVTLNAEFDTVRFCPVFANTVDLTQTICILA